MINQTTGSSRSTNSAQTPNKPTSLSDSVLALSQHSVAVEHTTPWYQREAWLAVCLVSFMPIVVAIFAPESWKIPLIISSGTLMLVSMVMLSVHRRRQSAERQPLPERVSAT